MLATLGRIVFGSNFDEINAHDFRKERFKEIVKFSTFFEGGKLLWSVGQSLNDKGLFVRVLNGGIMAASARVSSLCLRFRMNPGGQSALDDCPTFRKVFSLTLDQFRNACVAATSLITWENSFGDHAVHMAEEAIKNGLHISGDVGKTIPAALICTVGLLFANGLDRIPNDVFLPGVPNLTRVIRVSAIAHAVYGLYPGFFKPVVEGFLDTMNFNPSTNPILFSSVALACVAYLNASAKPELRRNGSEED